VIRIVIMGGSTVWGSDAHLPFAGTIDNRDTIAGHLEAILNAKALAQKRELKVQVVNAGVVGYRLFQDFIYFNHVIAHYQPDLVIAMDGHNDLEALEFGLKAYRHRNEAGFDQALNDPRLSNVLQEFLRYLESKSLFVRKVSLRLGELVNQQALSDMWKKQYERRPPEPEIAAWLADYIETVRRFDVSVRIAGARALFVVQAEALGERHKSLTSTEKDIQEYWKSCLWLHTVVRDRLLVQLEEAGREYGIWTANVSDTFKDASEQVYIDYTHLSSYGSRLMAERLATIIEKEAFKSFDGRAL
jgi:lysophospholipase L1-like esterase